MLLYWRHLNIVIIIIIIIIIMSSTILIISDCLIESIDAFPLHYYIYSFTRQVSLWVAATGKTPQVYSLGRLRTR